MFYDPAELKTCGMCKEVFPTGEFPVTTSYGRLVVRTWCKECLKEYFRARHQRKKKALANSKDG